MVDHFNDFKGFYPEGRFEGYSRSDIAATLGIILADYRGKEITLDYNSNISGEDISENLTVPSDNVALDMILMRIETDRVEVSSPENFTHNFILQRIFIGTQSITEIDRRTD